MNHPFAPLSRRRLCSNLVAALSRRLCCNLVAALALSFTACTDTLLTDTLTPVQPSADDDADCIQFSVSTIEQADMTIGLGQTRAALSDSLVRQRIQADHYAAHALEGYNPGGLTVHRMPLPYMGIHPRTVGAPRTVTSPSLSAVSAPCAAPSLSAMLAPCADPSPTRAPKSEIVSGTNFHDSLSIWGCVYNSENGKHRFLFGQTLLKRIRNYRSSVHWPYENTTEGEYGHETESAAPWKGEFMRFCVMAPAFESINMSLASEPQFEVRNGEPMLIPPTFQYTLPETAAEMRDVLFGMSDPVYIDVQAGPVGDGTQKAENLGKDNKIIPLTFQHALTAIRFAVGTLPANVTIKQISLKGVYTRGTFNPAAADAATGTNGAWSGIDLPASTVYSIWPKASGTGPGTGVYIDNDSLFFMIPHTVTEAATLEVKISAPQIAAYQDGPVIGTQREHTLKCSLTGDVWKKGYTVTYLLTIGEVEDGYYLVADAPAAHEHSTSTTSGSFPVHSYHSYWDYSSDTESKTRAVNWKVVGYSLKDPSTFTETDDFVTTNPASWLSSISGSSSGTTGEYLGGDGSVATYTIAPQSYTKEGNHEAILGRNSQSQASNLDLSTTYPDGTSKGSTETETANCYIVNRQGSYKFPLIYGNKTSDGTEADAFVDHKGTVISYRYIRSQIDTKYPENTEVIVENVSRKHTSYTWNATSGASQTLRSVIVWQDVSGLISTSTTSTDIGFTVSQSKPGNAVIALQGRTQTVYEKSSDSGTTWVIDTDKGTSGYEYGEWETFWTWHIWVTDEVYKNTGIVNGTYDDSQFLNATTNESQNHLVTITNYGTNGSDGTTATILPVNLGWVPDAMDFGYYAHREVWVKLQQTEAKEGGTPATCVVKIEQHARQPLVTGTSTVYQWGRPTALPAVCDINKNPRTIYMGSNFSSETFTVENISSNKGDIISSPTKLFRTSSSGTSWFDTGSVPAYWASTKTVYDPCPPGFQLPDYSIFTGFSLTGATAATGTSLNMWQDAGAHGKGAYFYTHPNAVTVSGDTNGATYTAATGHDRYKQTVYMPATGQYTANKPAGTALTTASGDDAVFIDASAGMVWGYGYSGTNGQSLWFYPDWNRNDSSKPAIQLFRPAYFSTAMPIRPTGNLPAY